LNFLESRIDVEEDERIVIPINASLGNDIELLQASLDAYPGIRATAASSHVPSFYGDSWPVRRSLEDTPVQTENFVVTPEYPKVMAYRLLAGRMLNGDLQSDVDGGFVLNETCIAMLGFDSNEEAIGQTVYFGNDQPKQGKVIGVVKDFHFDSFREKIGPALFQFKSYDWMDYKFLVVKVPASEALNAIKSVETEIAKIDPDWVVEASFFGDHFKGRYLQETNQGKLATSLTLVAIMLTCLGQIGLILHYVLSRQKEMAIRKVLGATVQQLWRMMTRSYVLLMGVSITLAAPVSLYFLTEWLNSFYYRITLGPKPFILATLAAGFIVLGVITSVALNAAKKNPVQSLSEE
jgi:putative ABC transport system permease protein